MSELPLPIAAWLIEGGRIYGERVCSSDESADLALESRKDGSIKSPLVRLSDAQAAIAAVEAERDRAISEADALLENVAALEAECAELREHATLYRWLRTQNWYSSNLFVVAGGKSRVQLGTDCPSLDRLDDAIRAAMEGQEHG